MATGKLFGQSSTLASEVSAANYVQFVRFQAGANGIAKKLYFYVGSIGGKAKLALYSDSSSSPGTVLAQSAMSAVSANGWAALDISDVTITSGTYYWLAFHINCYLKYAASGSLARKYKAQTFSESYIFTDSPSGLTSDNYDISIYCAGILTVAPSGIASGEAHGSPAIKHIIAPSGIDASAAFGTPSILGGGITAQGIDSSAALGSPAVILKLQILSPSAISSVEAHGSAAVTLRLQLISPDGIASVAAFGMPSLYQGNITITGIPPGTAFGTLSVIRYPHHVILEASYVIESPELNRAFIIGQDGAGSIFSDNAIAQADVDLVGERLEVKYDGAVNSSAVAAAVAAALLARASLDGSRGVITIPPHCGLELFDVIGVVDKVANQSTSYRITGYELEYDTASAVFTHTLTLSAV